MNPPSHRRVTCLYLTRGEAGISGKTQQEAVAIRTAEAEKACRIHHDPSPPGGLPG